jgi:hypothetical protein
MKFFRVTVAVLVLSMPFGTARAGGQGKFSSFDYYLLPDWCDAVYVTKDDQRISELRLGEVYTFKDSGPARIGYLCKQPGHGGAATYCRAFKLAHVIFGLNIEGRKEKKISVLCIN